MLHRPAKIGVNNQRGVTPLRGSERKIRESGRLSFAWSAADHRDRVRFGILAVELDVRAQDSIGLGVGSIARLLVQELDVLRNDREPRHAEQALDVFHRLYAGVEIPN